MAGRVSVGALLLEKYNQPGAVKAFDKALAMNPRAAERWSAKARRRCRRWRSNRPTASPIRR